MMGTNASTSGSNNVTSRLAVECKTRVSTLTEDLLCNLVVVAHGVNGHDVASNGQMVQDLRQGLISLDLSSTFSYAASRRSVTAQALTLPVDVMQVLRNTVEHVVGDHDHRHFWAAGSSCGEPDTVA